MARVADVACPRCSSSRVFRNGWKKGKQTFKCSECSKNFIPESDKEIAIAYCHDGKRLTIPSWAKEKGVSDAWLRQKIKEHGFEEAIKMKPKRDRSTMTLGERFGRLTVVKRADFKPYDDHASWLCKCDCGNTIEIPSNSLRQGRTKSCGCLRKEYYAKIAKGVCAVN